jgi:hypothetical protein
MLWNVVLLLAVRHKMIWFNKAARVRGISYDTAEVVNDLLDMNMKPGITNGLKIQVHFSSTKNFK